MRLTSAAIRVLPVVVLSLNTSCKTAGGAGSATQSDWQGAAAANGTRAYAIDWSCEPKRYDSSAETDNDKQEEYCEWMTDASSTATQKVCRFTTSFDNSRDFYLNSRGVTSINSISAAQKLRDDCAGTATRRLQASQGVGHACSAVAAENCVPDRNSDPEICDKVRWVVGQNYNKKLSFSIDQMPPDWTPFSAQPLMRLNLLPGLPSNCTYSQPDQTEVKCTVDPAATCFSVAGQMRPSLRVITGPYVAPTPATGSGSGSDHVTATATGSGSGSGSATATTTGSGNTTATTTGSGAGSIASTAATPAPTTPGAVIGTASAAPRNPPGSGVNPVVPGNATAPAVDPHFVPGT